MKGSPLPLLLLPIISPIPSPLSNPKIDNHFPLTFPPMLMPPCYPIRYQLLQQFYWSIINRSTSMSSNNDNSLLGFLQKKSLFSNSPNKNSRKRSRSKSRDSRNFDKRSNIAFLEESPRVEETRRQLFQEEPRLFNNFQQEAPKEHSPYRALEQPISQGGLYQQGQNYQQGPSYSLQQQPYQQQPYQQQQRTIESPSRAVPSERSEGGLWSGMLMSASSFQSARLESSHCLQNLSGKIRKQLSSVTYRIDAFNSKMGKVISNEFKALRERVLKVVDDAFKESEKYIKEYMLRKEQQLTNQLAQMRTLLEKEAARVDEMKEELNKPQWRKVAGEILSTDFEKRVEELVKKSETLEAGHWELGDIAGYRIKNIENELREIIRLKT